MLRLLTAKFLKQHLISSGRVNPTILNARSKRSQTAGVVSLVEPDRQAQVCPQSLALAECGLIRGLLLLSLPPGRNQGRKTKVF